ncbi:hypothetical protein [Flagellimonas flava]|uniref:hypothetical protein n=1 Tax=Flagellimonas flava TaxID=570519 RepID=UPI003D650F4C
MNPTFEDFWNAYDKKVGKKSKIEAKWNKLSLGTKLKIMDYIPKYKEAQPNKKYRKNPETFFNNDSWEDEIIYYNRAKVIPVNEPEHVSVFDKMRNNYGVTGS